MKSIHLSSGTFTLRLWPTLITLFLFVTLLFLGTWQWQRLAWKEALIATIAARQQEIPFNVSDLTGHEAELEYRPAIAAGHFQNDKTLYLNAISLTGEGGYHVLTPLVIERGKILLVDRGWIPYASKPPNGSYTQPDGTVVIKGLLRTEHPTGYFTPANHPETNDWYSIDLAAMSAAHDETFLPYVLAADATPNPDGLPIGGQTRVELPNNHLGYALTWFALAIVVLVIYGVSSFKSLNR